MTRDGSSRLLTRAAAGSVLLAWLLAGCSSSGSPTASATASTWTVGTPGSSRPTSGAVSPSAGGGTSAPAATSGFEDGVTPAQPSAEASRDGVPPSVAVLLPSARIHQVPRGPGGYTRVTTYDGIWMISRPEGAPEGYAEVLHLDGSGQHILKAYPFPELAPQWLLPSQNAIYCGRHGTAAAPDAMVCRIDRTSAELRVRVSADLTEDTAVTEDAVAGRPGRWVIDDRNFTADLGVAPHLTASLTFTSGGTLRLDPDTLAVLGS